MADAFEEKSESYKVGNKTLLMKPLKLRRFKLLLKIIEDSIGELQGIGKETKLGHIADVATAKSFDVMTCLFPPEEYPFMTRDFVEDNFTLPMTKKIIDSMIEMNGLHDFFPALKKGGVLKETKEAETTTL